MANANGTTSIKLDCYEPTTHMHFHRCLQRTTSSLSASNCIVTIKTYIFNSKFNVFSSLIRSALKKVLTERIYTDLFLWGNRWLMTSDTDTS